MLMRMRNTSTLLALCAIAGYRLLPPCSIVGIWNPAVLAIAWRWSEGLRSALFLGIAGNFPLAKPGTAWGNTKFGSRSGLFVLLRYRVHQLVSRVSCMRFVSRGFPLDPVALLPCKVRNGSRLTVAAPFEAR